MQITEPAADLAAAAALLSSRSGAAIPSDTVYFGEISLSGAIRSAAQMTTRLKEAQKLGFARAFLPAAGELEGRNTKLTLTRMAHLKELAQLLAPCQ